jgi:hypothetical protein
LRAAKRKDWNSRCAERFHIAVYGAFGDFEEFGELAAREAATGLKQEQGGEEPVGLHGRNMLERELS